MSDRKSRSTCRRTTMAGSSAMPSKACCVRSVDGLGAHGHQRRLVATKHARGDGSLPAVTPDSLFVPGNRPRGGLRTSRLREARGRYVIRLDGDNVFDENILLVLGNVLDRDGKLALVFPRLLPGRSIWTRFSRKSGASGSYSANRSFDLPPNGACTLVRASILKEVGGYREDVRAKMDSISGRRTRRGTNAPTSICHFLLPPSRLQSYDRLAAHHQRAAADQEGCR